jgi:glutamate/tyrosine decarboxylase-like PLP-dependent enzyme
LPPTSDLRQRLPVDLFRNEAEQRVVSIGVVEVRTGFGFVNGGALPVGLAARWMADVWDQNTAHYVMSPINSRLEEVCERWIVSLLGFPEETAAGFVSGTTRLRKLRRGRRSTSNVQC